MKTFLSILFENFKKLLNYTLKYYVPQPHFSLYFRKNIQQNNLLILLSPHAKKKFALLFIKNFFLISIQSYLFIFFIKFSHNKSQIFHEFIFYKMMLYIFRDNNQ